MNPAAKLLALGWAGLSLSGCYVLHAANGQWDVMAKRRPIERVVSNPRTEPALRAQLESVVSMRKFAIDELGLPDNGSYRSYADIGRPFVVWNVFATPEFSVEPTRWCFPIAGCVAYRGYFSESLAHRFAARLRKRGSDVFVGGIAAYSTLGHFEDPVLNTMIGWSDVRLASIIFHELSHQLVYVANDSPFNEAFASVVEEEGVRRWLKGRPADLEAFKRRQRKYLEFATLLTNAREDLRALYASIMPEERMRREKAEAFALLSEQYEKLRALWGGTGAFDEWAREGFNNAHLVSVATYQDCVPGLQRLLQSLGGDLPKFYEAARALVDLDQESRHAKVCEDAQTLAASGTASPAEASSGNSPARNLATGGGAAGRAAALQRARLDAALQKPAGALEDRLAGHDRTLEVHTDSCGEVPGARAGKAE